MSSRKDEKREAFPSNPSVSDDEVRAALENAELEHRRLAAGPRKGHGGQDDGGGLARVAGDHPDLPRGGRERPALLGGGRAVQDPQVQRRSL